MRDFVPSNDRTAHRRFMATFVVIGMLGWTHPARADDCVEERLGGKAVCTANDIRITDITDITITDDGCKFVGDTVTFNATLTVETTAQARYDIGLFVAQDGTSAQTGDCAVYSLPISPTPPFRNLDQDQCGDSTQATVLQVPVTGITVECTDANSDNDLDVATCTTWQQNSGAACGGADDVTPGTSSKCNCPETPSDIPIFVPDPVCATNADCEVFSTGCNVGTCDTSSSNADANGCVAVPTDSLCDDDLFCNGAEFCDASTGCVAGTAPVCADGVDCTDDSCNEATDSCTNSPDSSVCNDDLFCNGAESCNASTGCVAGTAPVCADNVDCTDDSCNEATDSCTNSPDNSACDDDAFCNGTEICNASTGCTAGTAMSCDDGIECTLDACDEAANACLSTGSDLACDDQNDCTADLCAPSNGCEHESICEEGICRSPGFWSTHGGAEKNSVNITQEVLDAVGGIEVCGQTITETDDLGGLDSALEALCVRVQGNSVRQLYRQLVAAALNCAISGSSDCDGTVGQHTDISFDACSMLCAGDDVSGDATIHECIAQLDCYNNGGEIIDGDCAFGTCSVTNELCGGDAGECPDVSEVPQTCENFPGNCHDAELCNDEVDVCPAAGARASSSRTCKAARDNVCTIDECE